MERALPGTSKITQALGSVAQALTATQDPWWIIGSAAVALHLNEGGGGDPGTVADIDVLTSKRDLEALYNTLPLTNTPEAGKGMFRSDLFGRWSQLGLDVEFMAGLKVRVGEEWQGVEPQTRQAIPLGDHTLYVPERVELITILNRFGRSKDLKRAAILETL